MLEFYRNRMKLIIYLTVCALAAAHAIPDQTWNAISEMKKANIDMEKRFREMEKNLQHQIEAMATRIEMIEQTNERLQRKNLELTNQIQELGGEVFNTAYIIRTVIY